MSKFLLLNFKYQAQSWYIFIWRFPLIKSSAHLWCMYLQFLTDCVLYFQSFSFWKAEWNWIIVWYTWQLGDLFHQNAPSNTYFVSPLKCMYTRYHVKHSYSQHVTAWMSFRNQGNNTVFIMSSSFSTPCNLDFPLFPWIISLKNVGEGK